MEGLNSTMAVDGRRHQELFQTVHFWDEFGYGFCFSENTSWNSSLPFVLGSWLLIPATLQSFHCLLCADSSLVQCSSLLHFSGQVSGETARNKAEALLAEAPGKTPSATAPTEKSLMVVSEDNHMWICSAIRLVPEAGAGG